jgi:hypothetical protein
MSMEGSESRPMSAPLVRRVREEAHAIQIADAVVAVWQEIDAALTPILGTRGLAALCKHSLYLAGLLHPRLAATPEGIQAPLDFAALKSVPQTLAPPH